MSIHPNCIYALRDLNSLYNEWKSIKCCNILSSSSMDNGNIFRGPLAGHNHREWSYSCSSCE